jgi:hypothetical protein
VESTSPKIGQLVQFSKTNNQPIDENSPDPVILLLILSTVLTFLKRSNQGCQMVCFKTKNPNLGKFWRVLLWKILVYFMTIWSILLPLKIFYGHLVYFVVIWYIFPRFVILDQEKSGNPGFIKKTASKFVICYI